MSDTNNTPRPRATRPITVHVVQSTEVIDIDGWARAYVAAVLRLEGYDVPAHREAA